MDPEENRKSPFILTVLCVLALTTFLVWEAYSELAAGPGLFRPPAAGQYGPFGWFDGLVIIILFLVLIYIRFFSGARSRNSPSDPYTLHEPSPRQMGYLEQAFSTPVCENQLTGVFSLVIGIFSTVVVFGATDSGNLTLIFAGSMIAGYGVVGYLEPKRENRWLLFFVVAIVITPLFVAAGKTFSASVRTGVPLMETVLHSPGLLMLVSLVIVIFLVTWVWLNGLPFKKNAGEDAIQDSCEEDLDLPLPYERVLAICLDSVKELPDSRIDDYEPDDGLLGVTISPDSGRPSRILIEVEKSAWRNTRVTIRCTTYIVSPEDAPEPVTGMNEKYVRSLVSSIRSAAKVRSR